MIELVKGKVGLLVIVIIVAITLVGIFSISQTGKPEVEIYSYSYGKQSTGYGTTEYVLSLTYDATDDVRIELYDPTGEHVILGGSQTLSKGNYQTISMTAGIGSEGGTYTLKILKDGLVVDTKFLQFTGYNLSINWVSPDWEYTSEPMEVFTIQISQIGYYLNSLSYNITNSGDLPVPIDTISVTVGTEKVTRIYPEGTVMSAVSPKWIDPNQTLTIMVSDTNLCNNFNGLSSTSYTFILELVVDNEVGAIYSTTTTPS